MNSEKTNIHRFHEEIIALYKETFMDMFCLSEETLDQLDPYRWGNHDARYRLWIIRGYIEFADESKNPLELISYNYVVRCRDTFRHLDDKGNNDNIPAFKEEMKVLGFKINQIPSRSGPWGLVRSEHTSSPIE